jgi:uncharacterized protein (TIGR02001 family)
VTARRVRGLLSRAAAVASALLIAAGAAHAQLGAAVALQSDYRFRGLSLSGEKPSARLTVSFDDPAGWYAGASAAGVELEEGRRSAELLAYAGRAARLASGLAWELGATAVHFTDAARYDYAELHAGLIGQRWTARVHFAPDYYGRDVRTLYAEINAARPLSARVRLFGHAGALVRLDSDVPLGGRRARADLRAGVAASVDAWDVQLAWVAVQRERITAYATRQDHSTVVLGASLAF